MVKLSSMIVVGCSPSVVVELNCVAVAVIFCRWTATALVMLVDDNNVDDETTTMGMTQVWIDEDGRRKASE
ncbi:unnamed protein product [Acanthocheilonema viteae]|uniref:Uncharacterized protein n=1 Tax=Acanthocheilonema viteae TaxID=6277 RepID=A0A498SNL8_ACAVI|nr:unnamed protein product [Acanthocheilonema viteae]